jgi:hypothetical protein
MAEGAIPADLPWIKAAAVPPCGEEFATLEEAKRGLRDGLTRFYRENHPEVLAERGRDVERAIAALQTAYEENIFPAMKARWSAYPEHIGHLVFPGCFRCHLAGFASDAGEQIRTGCDLCHLISSQGPAGSLEAAPFGVSLEFRHPTDIGEEWKEALCSDCHEGLLP